MKKFIENDENLINIKDVLEKNIVSEKISSIENNNRGCAPQKVDMTTA